MTEEQKPELRMTLQYDDENDLFVLSYLNGEHIAFQIKMGPLDFEKLTGDMVRTVKNYNLMKAQQYLEKKEQHEQGSDNLENRASKVERIESSSEQPAPIK